MPKRILMICLVCMLLLGCTQEHTALQRVEAAPTESDALQIVMAYLEELTPTVSVAASNTLAPTPKPTMPPADTPAPTNTPVPTPTPPLYTAADGVYTIAWISDPQHYSKKFPELYEAMTAFLRDNQEALHLSYIIHTGDLVHVTSDDAQWQAASRAQSYIDEIPNGVLAGNHDCQSPDGFGPYSKYFGEKRYMDKPWYGGSYRDNRGHYDLMTIGETDYLFVYMSFGPDANCIKWLNKVFASYPDRVGFLLLHDYFTNEFTLSKDGEKIYNQVVKKNPNLYFVLCGHRYGAYRETATFDDDGDGVLDRTVYQMLFNYQAAGKVGGDAYLRLIQIDETAGTMHVLTYSPYQDDFNRFDEPENREKHYEIDETAEDFVLPLPWKAAE